MKTGRDTEKVKILKEEKSNENSKRKRQTKEKMKQ